MGSTVKFYRAVSLDFEATRDPLSRANHAAARWLAGYSNGSTDRVLPRSSRAREIKELLDTIDFFVYPLVLPPLGPAYVHHDNHCNSVMEALACGVIVITWDVVNLTTSFGDAIVTVPHIQHGEYDPDHTDIDDPDGRSEAAVRLFADRIAYLEGHPEEKEAIRSRARAWALEQTLKDQCDRFNRKVLP